jgi:hypothetical protein
MAYAGGKLQSRQSEHRRCSQPNATVAARSGSAEINSATLAAVSRLQAFFPCVNAMDDGRAVSASRNRWVVSARSACQFFNGIGSPLTHTASMGGPTAKVVKATQRRDFRSAFFHLRLTFGAWSNRLWMYAALNTLAAGSGDGAASIASYKARKALRCLGLATARNPSQTMLRASSMASGGRRGIGFCCEYITPIHAFKREQGPKKTPYSFVKNAAFHRVADSKLYNLCDITDSAGSSAPQFTPRSRDVLIGAVRSGVPHLYDRVAG